MPQTTFTVDPGAGQAGQLASSADYQLNSATAEGAVPVGLFVTRGTDPEAEAKVPVLTTDVTDAFSALGFSYLNPSRESTDYVDNDLMTYVEKGEVFVVTEEAVTSGTEVFVRFASGGGGSVLGATRTDADTATAVALPDATFVSTTTAAGIAVVKFHR